MSDQIFKLFNTLHSFKVKIDMDEICELDIASKGIVLSVFESDPHSYDNNLALKVQALIDYTYEQINIGNWREVKTYLRKTITIASYLKLLIFLKSLKNIQEAELKEAFKIVDFGILFGCCLEKEPKLLQQCAAVLNDCQKSYTIKEIVIKSPQFQDTKIDKTNLLKLETLSCPSIEHFHTHYVLVEKPVILNDCIDHWPALEKWNDVNYLLSLARLRTVPIEVGRDYTDEQWTQKLMTIEDFVQDHLISQNSSKGYLAQYHLFDHIPALRNDISEPDYCYFSESDEPVEIMAWYGPKGTVTPIHHDPKKNLLAQVIGEKQIYLFSPKDSEYLYAHDHELLNNTAKVDPRNPDFEKYPNYKQACPYYCVLKPGQLLYIPPKWWHFVESLSLSFSVSFWWT